MKTFFSIVLLAFLAVSFSCQAVRPDKYPVVVSIDNQSDRMVFVYHNGPTFTGTSFSPSGIYGELNISDKILQPGEKNTEAFEVFANPHDVLIPATISIRPK